jgi:hypothetical protein
MPVEPTPFVQADHEHSGVEVSGVIEGDGDVGHEFDVGSGNEPLKDDGQYR